MRVHQQVAYVLVNRPYSETSWIVEVFSKEYGRLSLMAKGARRLKSRLKGVLLPFQPLLLSWTGKGEIPTLTSAEIDQSDFCVEDQLLGDQMICGFYCNELIVNLLHRHDPHSALYSQYKKTMGQLKASSEMHELSKLLRDFERSVIKETGYAVDFQYLADGKTLLDDNGFYLYQQGQGFVQATPKHVKAINGMVIKSFDDHSIIHSGENLRQSKQLMRDIINQMLANKKIHSRELFFPK